MKTAEIICVGTELLMGQIVNTNASFLASELAGLGIGVYHQSVVGDNAGRLEEEIRLAVSRSDIVLLSGGLGPTEDDLTKETAAYVAGCELVPDAEAKERIIKYMSGRGLPISDNNWKQALVPKGSIVLQNDNGTAPGIIIEIPAENGTASENGAPSENSAYNSGKEPFTGKSLILLPGPPAELKAMFEKDVKPYLKSLRDTVLVSKTIKICGVGESMVETMLMDLIDGQTNPTIATYAGNSEVHLRVTASGESEEKCEKLLRPVVLEIKSRFGDSIFTTDENVTLEQAVVDLLKGNNLMISTVESCTGGLLAARLTSVPGVSEIFKAGNITYSNRAKKKLLGGGHTTLEKYGPVSKEMAYEMCKGSSYMPGADVIVSVTGHLWDDNADNRPRGTVFIGCNVCGEITVEEFHFSGNREKIRLNATGNALILLRKCVLKYYSEKTFGSDD